MGDPIVRHRDLGWERNKFFFSFFKTVISISIPKGSVMLVLLIAGYCGPETALPQGTESQSWRNRTQFIILKAGGVPMG